MAKITPAQAIKAFCRKCQGLEPGEDAAPVRDCQAGVQYIDIPPCDLYPFRLGENPNIKRGTRKLSEEQKTKLRTARRGVI